MDIPEKEGVHLFLSGKVQRVGMRYYVLKLATELGLTGYVLNLHDGRVEAVAEGERQQLAKFVRRLEKSLVGRVEEVSVRQLAATGQHNSFQITHGL